MRRLLRCLTPLYIFFLSTLSSLLASEAQSLANATPLKEQKEIDSINQLSSSDDSKVGSAKSTNSANSELSGIMVDRTSTMAGKTFYRAFSQHAMGNTIIGNAAITIQEQPDARWGSQIWVMDESQIYFRTQLSPRVSEAERAAEEAVQIVEEALLRQQIVSAPNSDKDLGGDTLMTPKKQ
ncbi:CsgE family curli-type amyloid fiber assembly protein [Vreelandella nanhaiensis]|uniref:Curli production assembly/transport component CsgE n=1 Tax=Vreelandella nanhaiensis TaxID=1258546 RepID=A0A433KNB2_9GAMM|nr:CsgE family curli-type amyloid fiber assembly protein [Halomonas nanhaiensis]RUR31105.1 curli production assembly protein CsgE [Halomonas nanhaiensis]